MRSRSIRRPISIPIANQNVLLITIDTLRADALGSYGGPAATPALDRLAADGVRFEFAHAHAVTTLSSHASILTGSYPFQHGIRDNSGYRLPAAAQTVATLLKQAGYQTAAFVGAFPLHSRFGLNQGFDVYDDRFGETRAPTEFVMPERPATAVVPLARTWIAEREAGRAGQAGQTGGARAFQASDPGSRLAACLIRHAPYRPPPPFDAQYADRPYYGEVAATDAALAPLLDDLRAATRPTLVIVTGDHGEGLGDHGELTHGLFAYEATLRIPLIIGGDWRGRKGRRGGGGRPWGQDGAAAKCPPWRRGTSTSCRRFSRRWGRPPPADLPGRSLLPAASGAPARRRGRRTSKRWARCSIAAGRR